jgi:hypothetical protein
MMFVFIVILASVSFAGGWGTHRAFERCDPGPVYCERCDVAEAPADVAREEMGCDEN